MEVNFNELTSISRNINRTSTDAPFEKITSKAGKIQFRVSKELYRTLGLDTNSLSAKKTKDGKTIFIAVHPGNEGDFFKSRGSKAKGNASEHKDLAADLVKAGLTGSSFNLEKEGDANGIAYYKVVALAEPAVQSKPKKEKAVAQTA